MARIFCILNFSFCKSSFTFRTPVNWLQTLVDITLCSHFSKYSDLLCFKLVIKSNVRLIPLTDYTESFKLCTLIVNVAFYELFAHFTKFNYRNFGRVADTGFLSGFKLCRKTVRIPTGNIRSFKACHILVSHNKIFENLVERVTKVNITVCIRRTVVQNEQRLALVCFHKVFINLFVFPVLKCNRFAFRKTCSHREICLWKIKC